MIRASESSQLPRAPKSPAQHPTCFPIFPPLPVSSEDEAVSRTKDGAARLVLTELTAQDAQQTAAPCAQDASSHA
eukprot:2908796-Amphidinium_carterae.1